MSSMQCNQAVTKRPQVSSAFAAIILGTAICCRIASAQAPQLLPGPDLGNVGGSFEYALSFVDEAVPPATCADIAELIGAEQAALPPEIVGHAVRMREQFTKLAREGGVAGRSRSEIMQWVVADAGQFYIAVHPGGAHAGTSQVSDSQTLYRDGNKVFRADGKGIVEDGYSFCVDQAGDARFSDCPLHAEWQMHAGIVNYCLQNGTKKGETAYEVDHARMLATPPLDLPFDDQTVSYLARCEQREGGAIYTVAAFDGRGRVCREWSSTWFGGLPTQMVERVFVPFSTMLLETRDFRLLSHDAAAKLPDFAHMASVPHDRDRARDVRGAKPYEFDPRKGLPKTPKSLDAVVADRIEKLRADRDHGEQNKFIDNLNAWEAGQAAGEDGVPTTRRAIPERVAEEAAPVASVAAPQRPTRPRPSSLPVLTDPGIDWTWLVVGLVGGLAAVAGGVWFLRHGRRNAHTLVATAMLLSVGCLATGCADRVEPAVASVASAARSSKLQTLNILPKVMQVVADPKDDQRKEQCFYVTSRRGKPVKLLSAAATCGCVELSLPQQEIPPFATVRCLARFRPSHVKTVDIRIVWECDGERDSDKVRLTPIV